MKNASPSLNQLGQSVWLEHFPQSFISSGEFKRLIDEDRVHGLSADASTCAQAIGGQARYRDIVHASESLDAGAATFTERVVVRDIQIAADMFRHLYLHTKRREGYVSLPVSPSLARDAQGTLEETRRLWKEVARENLMIAIPASPECIPAVELLIGEGININVTLLFTQSAYERVAAAYLGGMERLARSGGDLARVASIASFCVGTVDSDVDAWITERLKETLPLATQENLRSLLGKVGCASAKSTYRKFLEIFQGALWRKLSDQGARSQRLLWTSAHPQSPTTSKVPCLDELVGPDTIASVDADRLESFTDQARTSTTLTENVEEAASIMDLAREVGIPLDELAASLLPERPDWATDSVDQTVKVTDRTNSTDDYDPMESIEAKLLKTLYDGRPHS